MQISFAGFSEDCCTDVAFPLKDVFPFLRGSADINGNISVDKFNSALSVQQAFKFTVSCCLHQNLCCKQKSYDNLHFISEEAGIPWG